MKNKNQWSEFYKDRVNSTYQEYFNKRYHVMIETIRGFKANFIREEGVGIGSITKALPEIECCFGFDLLQSMVDLAKSNNPTRTFYKDNIINTKHKFHAELAITHGVLEHFTDDQIKSIFLRYKKENIQSIHYVPLIGYKEPSFGDERLLPYQYWLNLIKPTDYFLFNNDCDLLLIK